MDYIRISQQVKRLVKKNENYSYRPGPVLPKLLFDIGLTYKGCSRTYNKLMSYNMNIIQGVKEKWEEILNEEINLKIVENAFKILPKIKESAYQKYFQFKLLHSRTAINDKLYKMKITDTNICQVCSVKTETIKHAFLECKYVISLWSEKEKWFKAKTRKTVKLSEIDKIFGRQATNETLLDKIILHTKTVIFNNRKNGKKHHINDVKKKLFRKLIIEEYQATLDSNIEKFTEVWSPIYDELYMLYGS